MIFRGKYYFLSNMYPCSITFSLGGKMYTFTCVEAAFQALKCPSRINEFIGIDGYAAKALGKRVSLRGDWRSVRVNAMMRLIVLKFRQHPELLEALRKIDGEIVEDAPWGDTFWGKTCGVGENHLGKILMLARDRL